MKHQNTGIFGSNEEKRSQIQQMFAKIAPQYDLLNGFMSLSQHRRWRRIAASMLHLKPGDSVLDLCTGTGDFIAPIRKLVGEKGIVIGLDFCEPMVRIGQQKHRKGQLGLGDAMKLPLQSESLNAVTVGWGIRNVVDIDQVHAEIFRVLKPGGSFASIDMAKPQNKSIQSIVKQSMKMVLPSLGAAFGKKEAYTYLPESIQHFWDREKLKESMEKAGFKDILITNLFFGNICIHRGMKPAHQPHLPENN